MIRLILALAMIGGTNLLAAEKPVEKAAVKVEIRAAEREPAEGLVEAEVLGMKEKVYLHKTAEITNADIASASATKDTEGNPAVLIQLTKEGSKKLAKFTATRVEKLIAIVVDGKVICAPVVKSPVADKAVITGTFTKDQVAKLVKGINGK